MFQIKHSCAGVVTQARYGNRNSIKQRRARQSLTAVQNSKVNLGCFDTICSSNGGEQFQQLASVTENGWQQLGSRITLRDLQSLWQSSRASYDNSQDFQQRASASISGLLPQKAGEITSCYGVAFFGPIKIPFMKHYFKKESTGRVYGRLKPLLPKIFLFLLKPLLVHYLYIDVGLQPIDAFPLNGQQSSMRLCYKQPHEMDLENEDLPPGFETPRPLFFAMNPSMDHIRIAEGGVMTGKFTVRGVALMDFCMIKIED